MIATTPTRFGVSVSNQDEDEDDDDEGSSSEDAPAARAPTPAVPATTTGHVVKKQKLDEGVEKAVATEHAQKDDSDESESECKICMDAKITTVVIPWYGLPPGT